MTPGNFEKRKYALPDGLDWRTRIRRRVYEIIEVGRGDDRPSKIFEIFIVTLILANCAAFVAETVPSLAAKYGPWFHSFEIISVAIFTIEYIARLWVAVEVPFLSRMPSWRARLNFAARPAQIIDLMAILPFYLGELLGIDLRVMRILRMLRFLKLSRYSPAMHTLIRVLTNERRSLMGAALLLLAAVLFASTGIYYIESDAQPDKFGSVPDAAWWAMATLTTVGYGDVAPITPVGRFFGSFVMVAGLCILALPVAIIAAGFAQEVSRRDFVVNWSLMSRIPMLSELEAAEVAEIMPLLNAHNMPPNTEVLPEGSEGKAMFFIASGRVKMRINDSESHFEAGDCFGETAMLNNDINHGCFITVAKCRLLKLHREDFNRLAAANPKLASHIRRIAEARSVARQGSAG